MVTWCWAFQLNIWQPQLTFPCTKTFHFRAGLLSSTAGSKQSSITCPWWPNSWIAFELYTVCADMRRWEPLNSFSRSKTLSMAFKWTVSIIHGSKTEKYFNSDLKRMTMWQKNSAQWQLEITLRFRTIHIILAYKVQHLLLMLYFESLWKVNPCTMHTLKLTTALIFK